MALPPGPRSSAFFTLLDWMRRPVASFERMIAEYGDIYSLKMPVVGTEVVVSHPDLIKAVLTGSPDVFLGGEASRALGPVLGDRSVLLLDGQAHQRERKLLMPHFTAIE